MALNLCRISRISVRSYVYRTNAGGIVGFTTWNLIRNALSHLSASSYSRSYVIFPLVATNCDGNDQTCEADRVPFFLPLTCKQLRDFVMSNEVQPLESRNRNTVKSGVFRWINFHMYFFTYSKAVDQTQGRISGLILNTIFMIDRLWTTNFFFLDLLTRVFRTRV